MVTRKSGTAIDNKAFTEKAGLTQVGAGSKALLNFSDAESGKATPNATTSAKAASAAGTAHSRLMRRPTTQAIKMGRASQGSSATALKGAKHSSSNTPASIALAR